VNISSGCIGARLLRSGFTLVAIHVECDGELSGKQQRSSTEQQINNGFPHWPFEEEEQE